MREVRSPQRRTKHQSIDAAKPLDSFFRDDLAVADVSESRSVGRSHKKAKGVNISVLDRNRDNFVFAQPERPVDFVGLGLNIAGKLRLSTKGVTKHAVQVL